MNNSLLKKINNLRRNKTLKNGALFSLFSFINRGFSFLLLMILANYIEPGEYGYLSLFSTVVMVIGYFISMSTDGYMTISYFKEGEFGIRNATSSLLVITSIFTFLFLGVLLVWGETLSQMLNLPLSTLYLAIIICFFTVYTNENLHLFRVKERVKIYGFFSCSNAFLNFIISILFVKTMLMGWEGRVYSQTLCFALFGIIGLFYLAKGKYIGKPNWNYMKGMLLWGIPLIPHYATNFIRQGCDRYIINYFHTIEDVGLLSFALNLTNIIIMIGSGFNQSTSVDIYKILGNKDIPALEKLKSLASLRSQIFKVYLFSSSAIVLACYILVPVLLPKYSESMPYFLILGIYGFFQCIYFLFSNYLIFYKKTKNIMYITFSSSVLHLGLSLLLTQYSLYFTCLIYTISQALVCLLIYRKAKKVLKAELV